MTKGVWLEVDGLRYGGWETVRIQCGMEQLAGSFELTIYDQGPARPIAPGSRCRVLVDDYPVITGWVDETDAEISGDSHSLRVSGRDATADLVDCSVVHRPGQWQQQTLAQIAAELCRPFGIPVRATLPLPILRRVTVQDGETVYELLDRLAKKTGVLLMADGAGGLLMTRPATAVLRSSLEVGRNLISARVTASQRERYQHYLIRGQRAVMDDEASSRAAASGSAQVRDTSITRYRPLIVMAESGMDLPRRAAWEARVRAGRGTRAMAVVPGWQHADGIWQANTRVRFTAPQLYTSAELMICSVVYTLDASGTRTELELADPQAFDLESGLRASPIGKKATGRDGVDMKRRGEQGRGHRQGSTEITE